MGIFTKIKNKLGFGVDHSWPDTGEIEMRWEAGLDLPSLEVPVIDPMLLSDDDELLEVVIFDAEPSWPTPEDWAQALEFGLYRQGYGSLVKETDRGDCFCCLGVYAELCNITPRSEDSDTPGFQHGLTVIYGLLGDAKPDWMTDDIESAATFANDTLSWSFKQIADWINAGMKLDNDNHPVLS